MARLQIAIGLLRCRERCRAADSARDRGYPLLGRHLGGDVGDSAGTDLGHVAHVRRRRGHFQRDALLFFDPFLQNDRAHPDELLAGRASAAEQPARKSGCD